VSELTEPQLRALREISASRVAYERYGRRYWSVAQRIRSDVVARLVDRGFAEVGEPLFHPPSSSRVLLSDRGREVLADA
jgi:hypothetical protein